MATINGTSGKDNLTHRAGDDVNAGAGDDEIYSRGSGGTIDGGEGYDQVALDRRSSNTFLSLDMAAAGTDTGADLGDGTTIKNVERLLYFLSGSGGSNVNAATMTKSVRFEGGSGTDTFTGGSNNDMFKIASSDVAVGNGGNDVFDVQGSGFTVTGGAGVDTVRVVGAAQFGAGSLAGVEKVIVADGATNAGAVASFSGVEVGLNITVSSAMPRADATVVTGAGSRVRGTAYDDVITGGAGDDVFTGNRGNDTLRGGEGNDTLDGGTGLDHLLGEGGNDTLLSKNPDGEDGSLDGGTGDDFAWIERTNEGDSYVLDVTSTTSTVYDNNGMGIANVERFYVEGGAFGDNIRTSDGTDTILGHGGDDVLQGRGGNDTIVGGAGTDYALYSGAFSDYSIVQNANGSVTVTDLRGGSPDGTDTLWTIEVLTFDGAEPGGSSDYILP